MIAGDANDLAFVLLAAGIVLAGLWFVVAKFAPRALRRQLRPIFAGGVAGVFLGIVYVMRGPGIALLLLVPVGIIAYFNITGRKRRAARTHGSGSPNRET